MNSAAAGASLAAAALVLGATDAGAQAAWAADEMPGVVIVDDEIPAPLTDQPGNPERGKQVLRNSRNVTCLICHHLPIPDEPSQGEIGPDLAGVGSRLSVGELRLRIVDPKVLNPDTIMPAFYRTDGLYRVQSQFVGRTIYTAQEVEDVVAYLASLKEP